MIRRQRLNNVQDTRKFAVEQIGIYGLLFPQGI